MSDIRSVLREERVFQPPADFAARAHYKSPEDYERAYRRSIDAPEEFWGEMASHLHWFRRWDRVLEWNVPWAKWFVGGQTNIAYNCLDRQIESGRRNKAALIWEGEPGDSRILTYGELHREVCRAANALRGLGVQPGDRVGIYMPLVPEAVVTMLACAP